MLAFGTATVAAQVYFAGSPIPALTLPQATGGLGPKVYALIPASDIPRGLALNSGTGVLTGTPTAATPPVTLTYTVRDHSAAVTLPVPVILEVLHDTAPDFGSVFIPAQFYTLNHGITALTLPRAAGGNGLLSYALLPTASIPAGLTLNPGTRTLSGTPTSLETASLTWIASDADSNTGQYDTAILIFSVTIQPDVAPNFGMATVAAQTYVLDTAITALTLPAATGGNGDLRYSLDMVPAGLILAADTRILSGTPTAVAHDAVYTWIATDQDGDAVGLEFTLAVHGGTTTCSRTAQVTAAIVTAVRQQVTGATCAIVTAANLGAITSLNLSGRSIMTLQSGDFAGLSALTMLDLSNNQLSTLPAGIFDGLSRLQQLRLAGNTGAPFVLSVRVEQQNGQTIARIQEAAPLDVAVTWEILGGASGATAIPAGSRASAPFIVPTTSLSSVLFSARFPGITPQNAASYTGFRLTVPAGVFLPRTLTVAEAGMATYPIRLSTEPAGNVVVTPTVEQPAGGEVTVSGAVTFTASSWSMARTVTVVAGGDPDIVDDSATITHTVSGYGTITTAPGVEVTVTDAGDTVPDFGSLSVTPRTYFRNVPVVLALPEAAGGNGDLSYTLTGTPPAGLNLNLATRTLAGTPTARTATRTYTWTASDYQNDTVSLVFTIRVILTDVCDRTPAVRNAIVGAIRNVSNCADVTMAQLRTITQLQFGGAFGSTPPRVGDFDGLSALSRLFFSSEAFTTLPAGIFDDLTALTRLVLRTSQLATLPAGLFNGLGALRIVELDFNQLRTLPVGLFDGLPAGLTELKLRDNPQRPLTMNVDIERQANGQARVRILQAVPSRVQVDWAISGGASGTATIQPGRRTSDGLIPASPSATIQLSNPRFPDVAGATDTRQPFVPYNGLRLVIAPPPGRPGLQPHRPCPGRSRHDHLHRAAEHPARRQRDRHTGRRPRE